MRPNRSMSNPYGRPTVDEVISEARRAVASARAQRDQLQAAMRDLEAENEALRRQLAERPQPAPPPPATDRSQRLEADLENLRRRTGEAVAQARLDTLVAAVEPFAEVVDSLGRALASNPDPDNPWFRGTTAILARTRAALARLGVETLGSVGQPFDPRLHEAVGTLQTPDFEPDRVIDVVKIGLRETASGTLIRPAQVVVASGGV